jgi:predicted 2-oxoglutarate/Fe(II)-dependent dioxygenase YbiX
MIEIIPNYFTEEELLKIISTLNESELEPLEYSNGVLACNSRKFGVGNKVRPLGNVVSQQLLVYRKGSSSQAHIDHKFDPNQPWIKTAILFCNDDYEGGELFFPNLKLEMKLPRNTLFMFPAGDIEIYKHGVKEVTQGTRMTAIFRFTTPV